MTETDTDEITVDYRETDTERVLEFEREGRVIEIAQNREGYAMLMVREGGDELERYYGFDMALDHAAERLGVRPAALPVPDPASDMGL
ncbi:DUF7111 family protein [Halalkalicoccus subterraneus]|uniref:DUF7111 family protein n=1 Tax=Halalkalicoccus subterraneus TaxID=2675002 RepID=UPI000EFAA76F|nr:hypothetical protein [Halalkalicoccus subterraneus]